MKKFILQYGSSFISGISSFIIQLLLLSFLTVEEYGYYNIGMSFSILFSILSNFGLDGIAKIKIPGYLDDRRDLSLFTTNLALIKILAVGIIFLPVMIITSRFISNTSHILLFTICTGLVILNQFYWDSIMQTSLEQKKLFLIKLCHGVVKAGGLVFIVRTSDSTITTILIWFVFTELIIFIYMYFMQFRIRPSKKSMLEIWHERKIAKHFNLNTLINIIVSPAGTIWLLAILNFTEKDIGYYSFIVNIVVLITDRFSIFNRLEAFMINYLLRNYTISRKVVINAFKSWKKLSLIYISCTFTIVLLFFERLDIFFFEGRYSQYFFTASILLFAKSITQLNYYFTALIIFEKKTHLFVKASLINCVILGFGYLIIAGLNLQNIDYFIYALCVSIVGKTIYLAFHFSKLGEFKVFDIDIFKCYLIILTTFIFGRITKITTRSDYILIEFLITSTVILIINVWFLNFRIKDLNSLKVVGE